MTNKYIKVNLKNKYFTVIGKTITTGKVIKVAFSKQYGLQYITIVTENNNCQDSYCILRSIIETLIIAEGIFGNIQDSTGLYLTAVPMDIDNIIIDILENTIKLKKTIYTRIKEYLNKPDNL